MAVDAHKYGHLPGYCWDGYPCDDCVNLVRTKDVPNSQQDVSSIVSQCRHCTDGALPSPLELRQMDYVHSTCVLGDAPGMRVGSAGHQLRHTALMWS